MKNKIKFFLFIFSMYLCLSCGARENTMEPLKTANNNLLTLNQIEYLGAFKLPRSKLGESNLNYSEGIIEYNPDNDSLFIVGHSQQQAIAEFPIPKIINSNNLEDLEISSIPTQEFSTILNRTADGNPQGISRITGMKYIDHKLVVNAIEYYDAPADNTHTTIIIDDARNIKNSSIYGYFEVEGAARAAGWISDIPDNYQRTLGSTHLMGFANGFPINSRLSIGPSLFTINLDELFTQKNFIKTTKLMEFNLKNFLRSDDNYARQNWQEYGYNIIWTDKKAYTRHPIPKKDSNGNIITIGNDLWTELSDARYGFIVPGTNTYAVFGSSGGNDGGIGYKVTQNNGRTCDGPCAYDAEDYYNYYWFFDINDIISSKNNRILPHEIRPYEYGKFPATFQVGSRFSPDFNPIGGGTFDAATSTLYLSIREAGKIGKYDNPPVILAYRINK